MTRPTETVEYWRKEAEFWREQQKLAANVAATIADLDETAPALRQLLGSERTRRQKAERECDLAESRGFSRGAAEQRRATAYEIRAELVCCDAYEQWHGKDHIPFGEVHEICFWGEAAAQIAERPLVESTPEAQP